MLEEPISLIKLAQESRHDPEYECAKGVFAEILVRLVDGVLISYEVLFLTVNDTQVGYYSVLEKE